MPNRTVPYSGWDARWVTESHSHAEPSVFIGANVSIGGSSLFKNHPAVLPPVSRNVCVSFTNVRAYSARNRLASSRVAFFARASAKEHYTIVNPCGEIPIAVWGAYCVIADTVPYHADDLVSALDAGAHAARALILAAVWLNRYRAVRVGED